MENQRTLFIRDNKGAVRVWRIHQEGNKIITTHGILGGKMQIKEETVHKGKAGRTLQEQIDLQIASKINRQIDKGYIDDYPPLSKAKNTLGLPKPMLALPLDKAKGVNIHGAIVQPKFDGNRCMIAKINGKIIAYTRNGKIVQADISHIFNDLDLSEGDILDGELYAHGYSLQTIVSWIKRTQENTKKLKYHLYDIVCKAPYEERAALLPAKIKGQAIELTPSNIIKNKVELEEYHSNIIIEGYEGAIIRWGDFPYEDGKRSKSLLKYKKFLDDYFKVIDVLQSKDGWAILKCVTAQGKEFTVSAPGTLAMKKYIYDNKIHYIGKLARVEFMNYTKDGVPFHPVAVDI